MCKIFKYEKEEHLFRVYGHVWFDVLGNDD